MSQFLFEILSEEIPARMQVGAMETLERLWRARLEAESLPFSALRVFSTPRRLTLVVDGLPAVQGDRTEEFRGPRIDAPEAAIQGFLKSRGVTLDDCTRQETDKGAYWLYTQKIPGRPTADVLCGAAESLFTEFPWPKSMRWGANGLRWVRPLISVLAVFDQKVVPLRVPQTDIIAGDTTRGHRFLSPAAFAVKDFDDYAQKLRAAHVDIDRAARRAKIVAEAEAAAKALGLSLRQDEALLDELCGLVEWPSAAVGSFDEEFLDVPQEALIAAMRGHQKYLSLLDANGRLSHRFVVITNMPPEGARGENIVSGNGRVLRARLSDARFFWEQDLKIRLDDRLPRLSDITFHAKLGTVAQKVARLETLAAALAPATGADSAKAARAAALCKADLVSAMVGEFPELQGLMGLYYATRQGEPADVAQAIADHYKPNGPADSVPQNPVGTATALADKIDTIAGFFAIAEKPTGSKDPYALRRAALGVIRIALEGDLALPLESAFEFALAAYAGQGLIPAPKPDALKTLGILDFICDRMKFALKEQGVRADVIDAVFSAPREGTDIARLLKRVRAVQTLLATPEGSSLLAGYKRAANIVRIEGEKDKRAFSGAAEPALLRAAEETALFDALKKAEAEIAPLLARGDYVRAMELMAALQRPVDAFFDKVVVNDNEAPVRENRLKLLAHVRAVVNQVADFSLIK